MDDVTGLRFTNCCRHASRLVFCSRHYQLRINVLLLVVLYYIVILSLIVSIDRDERTGESYYLQKSTASAVKIFVTCWMLLIDAYSVAA